MTTIYVVVKTLFDILSWAVIINALFSFILPPFHPVRSFLDRLVQPMLAPFKRFIPPIGGMDLSPIALLLSIRLVEMLVLRLLL
ncbi:MAG: YggT family protein [Anaerolineae bacterium]|jgi:YggT family protein|nr:YggT family protein [Anaerolineae bacterium]PKO01954.1 MAG: YggT family protein [Chloroflexi bacterium HGW-Chloroflexi-5]